MRAWLLWNSSGTGTLRHPVPELTASSWVLLHTVLPSKSQLTLATPAEVHPHPEAGAEESRDGRCEGQATGPRQCLGGLDGGGNRDSLGGPLPLLHLAEHAGAAGLGDGLGEAQLDTGDVALRAEVQAEGAGDRGEEGIDVGEIGRAHV